MSIEIVTEVVKNLQSVSKSKEYDEVIKFKKGVYIFISFDLVNSTLFKSRHMDMWPKFISSFYESVMNQFAVGRYRESSRNVTNEEDEMQRTGGFQLWKLVGDEVLLYHKVVSKNELYNTILHINDKRTRLIEDSINRYIKSNAIQEEEADNYLHLFKQYFEVKTTVWIASCAGTSETVSLDYPNLVYDSRMYSNEDNSSNVQFDFLGPDIDEGFRLCAYAEKKQMLVSPKLVYLLILAFKHNVDKINVFNLNFKIVNYVAMKGVWENRMYPIIMFCQCDLENGDMLDQWKKMFEYDAFNNSLLYANIAKYGDTFLQDESFSIRNLNNIYKDIVREEEMQAMLKVFNSQEGELETSNISYVDILWKKNPKFEFHISCLCYDRETEKYWITNHPNHGWSFGCTQVSQNTDFFDYVSQIYLDKYGLGITLNSSNEIISFYAVDRNTAVPESILGVVVLITDVNEKQQRDGIVARWITYEESKEITGSKIKNFEDILDKAKRLIEKNNRFFKEDKRL